MVLLVMFSLLHFVRENVIKWEYQCSGGLRSKTKISTTGLRGDVFPLSSLALRSSVQNIDISIFVKINVSFDINLMSCGGNAENTARV
jgi:hypothetical protein